MSIIHFEIIDDEGEILFSKSNFFASDPSAGWDGKDMNGNIRRGNFYYQLVLEIPNQDGTANYTGQLCVMPDCENSSEIPNIEDCRFGTQHNGNGGVDALQPTSEPSC